MRSVLTTILAGLALIAAQAQKPASTYDEGKPVGWATVGGNITGGEGGEEVTVTNFTEFDNAMLRVNGKKNLTVKRIIYVKGTITFSQQASYNGVENKTIIGLPGSVLTNMNQDKKNGGILKLTGNVEDTPCRNIILRNLTFKGPGAYDVDGNDNLLIQSGQRIWVDHCDFQDAMDGNFDINNGADNISVTWCRFRYILPPKAGGSGGSDAHCYSNLIGSSDGTESDRGHLNVTFANCWWDTGVIERCPRVRYGKVHLVNCLFTNDNYNYLFGTGYESNIYAEKCAFVATGKSGSQIYKNPGKNKTAPWNLIISDCIGTDDVQERMGSLDYFTPADHYQYDAMDKTLVQEVVGHEKTGAGATLTFDDDEAPSAIKTQSAAPVVRTLYYNMGGVRQSEARRGLTILSQLLADGTTTTKKIIR